MVDLSRFPTLSSAKPQREPQDKYEATIQEMDREEVWGNQIEDRDPVAARRANVLADKVGVPARLVEGDIKGFEEEARRASTVTLLDWYPEIGPFLKNPDNAARVKDDIKALGRISGSLGPVRINDPSDPLGNKFIARIKPPKLFPNLMSSGSTLPTLAERLNPNRPAYKDIGHHRAPADPLTAGGLLTGIDASITAMIDRSGLAIEDMITSGLGLNDEYRSSDYYARQRINIGNLEYTADQPNQQMGWAGRMAYGAAQSLAQVGVVAATGGGAAVLGAGTGLSSYDQFRERGAGVGESLLGGGAQGTIEFLTEKLPFDWLLGRFGKEGTKGFIKGYLAPEVAGEIAATVGQNWVDAMVTGGAGWEGYKANLGSDVLDTIAMTALSAGALGGTNAILRRLRPQERALDQAEAAIGDAKLVDDLMQGAASSKMRAEDPETLKSFVESQTQSTPVRNLYVPVEALQTYMQSEGADIAPLERFREQIEEAGTLNGDVVIPLGEVAAYLSGTPAWEAIKDQARTQPGGLSQKEALEQHDEILRTLEQRGAEIAEEGKGASEARSAAVEVYDEVKNRLLAGGVESAQAEAVAQVYAARYEVKASQFGGTPMEQFKASKIVFPGETPGTGSKRAKSRTLSQGEALSNEELIDYLKKTDSAVDEDVISDLEGKGAILRLVELSQVDGGDVDGESLDSYRELTTQAPPIVIKDGMLFEGNHRVALARERGEKTIWAYEVGGIASAPLEGLPSRIRVGGEVHTFGPNQKARDAAAAYMKEAGIEYSPPKTYAKADPERAARIAQAFDDMAHEPNAPAVKASYKAMIKETVAQWKAIEKTGLKVEFIKPGQADPYAVSPRMAQLDVQENNHLWVFPTDDGFGGPASAGVDISGNPLLELVKGVKIDGQQVRANDLFRIVHDYFGHIKEGVGFRADGEENAWRVHSAMYSPLARKAMTTETRGQNSWVNFGPFGEKNRTASASETEYAPQKIGLLPDWVVEEGAADGDRTLNQATAPAFDMLPEAGWSPQRISGLIDGLGYSDGSSKAFAVMMTPDQYLGLTASEKGRALIAERVGGMDDYGELDLDKLRASGAPMLIINLGGKPSAWQESNGIKFLRDQVMGHEGRHRATMLKNAGVTQFPVVVNVGNRTEATRPREPMALHLNPQRSRSDQVANGDQVFDAEKAIPISWKFKDQLEEMGGRTLFQTPEDVFYSAAQHVVEQSKQEKASAAQWKALLTPGKTPGIKAEEIEWSGIHEWLDMQTGSVSKNVLLQVLRDGGIQVDEVVLGRTDTEKLADYGIPEDAEDNEDYDLILADGEPQFKSWSSDPSNDSYRELLITLPIGQGGNPSRSPSTHWDTEAVVAHTRFMDKTDADGKRVLFIEEVQSDWHQKGRDQGYEQAVNAEEQAARKAQLDEAQAAQRTAYEAMAAFLSANGSDAVQGNARSGWTLMTSRPESHLGGFEGEVSEKAHDLIDEWRAAELALTEAQTGQGLDRSGASAGIPNAPFKTSWPALVMKRAIRWAAENGYDRIAWTTGEEQADRYNLTSAVGSLTLDGMQDSEGHRVRMSQAAGSLLAEQGLGENTREGSVANAEMILRMTEGQMREAFGNDITKRLLESDGETLSGDGLKIGGEGMKAFYDRNLVNITNDIIKKYGAKVEPVVLVNTYDADAIAALTPDQRVVRAESIATRPVNPGFEITDKLREAAMGGLPLFQNKEGPRGSVTFTNSGEKIVQLFSTANRSTLLHETMHIFVQELFDDAQRPDAPDQLKADVETMKAWFKKLGHPVGADGVIPKKAHEYAARGGERYFMEGKSPSAALRDVFKAYRAWMLRIYQVVDNLRAPITPEVRDVFARMLATQEAIDTEREVQHVKPLFASAEEAGMTEAEFADYQTRVGDARDEAYDTLLYKTMEAIRRREQAKYKDQRANVRAEAAAAINARPETIALHLLRTGRWLGDAERPEQKVKLDVGYLIDTFGEDVLTKLPRGMPITSSAGIDGDTLAEMVGAESGQQLVHALIGMRAATDAQRASGDNRSLRDSMVEHETDRVMSERHGDLMIDDGSIEEEAIAALNTARQGEIIASELKQLNKRTSALNRATPYQFVREWAKRKVSAGKVIDVASRAAVQQHTRAAAKASRLAEKAILEGDVDEAYRQKQAQLLNHALLAESKAAADRIDVIVARMKRLAKRAAMKSVDPDYLAKVHMLLENYDFRPRSQKSIDEQEGFQAWIADQRAKGFEVHIPPRLENKGDPYSRVSVQELESLGDIVDSLIHLGRTKQTLVTAGRERDYGEWRDEVLARIRNLPDRKLPDKPINEDARMLASAAAELLKVEALAEELDGGKLGPMNDLLVRGSTTAENKRHELRHNVLQPIAQLYNSLGRKQWKHLQDKVTIPELTWNTLNEGDPRKGQPVTITRMELLSVALNMGNLSNLTKLSKGERWPVATLRAVVNRELTKTDWDFVQSLWDQVNVLWPDIVATEREMSGLVPEQVTSMPIETEHGTYRGGYWPVVYDAARWQRAEDIEQAAVDDMFGIKSGVATQKGHTIERTEAFGPMNLSLERVLFAHVEQAITRIAFAPFARNVLRAMRDTRIRGLIDTKLGSEYRKQVEPWLGRQINEGAVNLKAARWWTKVLRQTRINMTMAAMGFRISTGVAQTLGLAASAQRIGGRWVARGLRKLALHPQETAEFAFSRSEELMHRSEAVNREVAEVAQKMRGKHGALTTMQNWAFKHIAMIDRYVVALPTWIGAYDKAISQGMDEDEAIALGDKAVRMSQGSGREKDLSPIQSMANGDAMKFFTMFYSPFNVMFNAQWQGVRAAKRDDFQPLIMTTFWWMLLTPLADALMSGDWPDEDDDMWLGWFSRNIFFNLFAGVPFARDLASGAERKISGQYADIGSTPLTRTYDAIERSVKIGDKLYEEGEGPDKPIKTGADLTATLTGLPIAQPGATAQFFWDVNNGDVEPDGVSDWYFGITKGKVPEDKGSKQ